MVGFSRSQPRSFAALRMTSDSARISPNPYEAWIRMPFFSRRRVMMRAVLCAQILLFVVGTVQARGGAARLHVFLRLPGRPALRQDGPSRPGVGEGQDAKRPAADRGLCPDHAREHAGPASARASRDRVERGPDQDDRPGRGPHGGIVRDAGTPGASIQGCPGGDAALHTQDPIPLRQGQSRYHRPRRGRPTIVSCCRGCRKSAASR